MRSFSSHSPEAAASDTGIWRAVMGIGKADTVEEVARKVAQGLESRTNYEVVFYLQQAVPEFLSMISANADLVMESKARWDAGARSAAAGGGPGQAASRARAVGGKECLIFLYSPATPTPHRCRAQSPRHQHLPG